jgi:hypothetical protein
MRTTTMAALVAAVALAGCRVKVNDAGKLPEVDVREKADGGAQVNVKPGTLPDVDVKTDSVSVPRVEVPNVQMPEVKAPKVEAPDVHLPSVNGRDTTHRDTARRS